MFDNLLFSDAEKWDMLHNFTCIKLLCFNFTMF